MAYWTIQEGYLQNGHRHKANAERYLAEGNVKFAIGSLRKAIRNYERYQSSVDYDEAIWDAMPAFGRGLVQGIMKSIADKIIHGS